MKKTTNKYTYYKVLQSNSGYGWDDEVFYDKSDKAQLKELIEDRKVYQAEGIRTRVIERRELNQYNPQHRREKESQTTKERHMKKTTNKYTYYKVLQSNSGYGWDDEVFYDKSDKAQLKELIEDRKAYQAEGIRTRVIERRELN